MLPGRLPTRGRVTTWRHKTGQRLCPRFVSSLALWALAIANLPTALSAPEDHILKVESGSLKGVVSGGVIQLRGIPYAAPPLGVLRWAAPKSAPSWTGIRDSSQFASTCPQGKSFNEDCLYLNVTVPLASPSKKRKPVMVWLHGGGLSAGSPDTYDAARLVAQGDVVFVGIEFRVNVFGFFAINGLDGGGAFGFEDQQAALLWIKRNIRVFGGDPENITLFGESGGAISTCAQLVSPGAGKLFTKAILQSGTCSVSFPRNAAFRGQAAGAYYQPLRAIEAKGAELAAKLGCTGDPQTVLACLRTVPAEKIAAFGGGFYSAAFGGPRGHTSLLPIDPASALQQNTYSHVPVITGNTRDEARAMASGFALNGKPITDAEYPALMRNAFDTKTEEVLTHYPILRFGTGALAWSAAYTDRMFVCPQLRDAKVFSQSVPVYAYEFADPHGVGLIPFLPDFPSGAAHSGELPLLFDLTDGPYDLASGKKIPLTGDRLNWRRP